MMWSDAAAARLRMITREWGRQDELVLQTGIPKATLQRILKGSDPGPDRLARLCAVLDTTPEYILTGGGGDNAAAFSVPLYDVEVAAGHGRVPLQDAPIGHWPFPRDWIAEHFGEGAKLKMVRVSGDSQEPELRDGDSVMIDSTATRLSAGMHVVRLDDALLIKRLQLEGRIVRLVSNNRAYSDIEVDIAVDADRFEIMGKAVWAGKLL